MRQPAIAQPANQNLQSFRLTAVDKDGKLITTLQQNDIRITFDGTPQTISKFEFQQNAPVALFVLVDTSTSQEYVLPLAKVIADIVVTSLASTRASRFGIVSFTNDLTIEQNLTDNRANSPTP